MMRLKMVMVMLMLITIDAANRVVVQMMMILMVVPSFSSKVIDIRLLPHSMHLHAFVLCCSRSSASLRSLPLVSASFLSLRKHTSTGTRLLILFEQCCL